MVILPLMKSHACNFVIPLCICGSIAQWLCVLFQLYIWFSSVDFISALVNFISERSLSGKESQFLSEVVFAVTFGIYLCNLGTFWVVTNWCHFQGTKVQICPGKTTEFEDQEKISVGKQEFLSVEKVVYLPWRFHCKNFQILRSHSSFEQTHTR